MIFSKVNEDEFELDKEFTKQGVIYKELRLKNSGCRCKDCSTYHTKVKEYRLKKIRHSLYANSKCVILWHQRRFICPNCGHTQMEEDPFRSDHNRVSDKTIRDTLDMLKRYNVPFRQAAQTYNLTTRAVIKIFDKYVKPKRNELTVVICLDEVYFSRHRKKKFVLVIINFFNRAVLDVLKDRDKSTLSSYFKSIPKEERDRVRFIGVDMNDTYRDVAYKYFPNATLVADSFHVIKNLSEALDSLRKRVMRKYENDKNSDEYYLFKYRKELLFIKDEISDEYKRPKYNHHFHYEISESQILEMMLAKDQTLKNGYELYHEYIRFNDADYDDTVKCLNDLSEIINDYKLSDIKEFMDMSNTLENWKAEIVNSFIKYNGSRVSNGPIEGRNSMIKKILKIANGYTNFKRFRNRVMYCLNKYTKDSFEKQY